MSEFPHLETHDLRVQAGVRIFLHRYKGAQGGLPVLLIHGASARHETFEIPARHASAGNRAPPQSLMEWLADQGYQPWLLDWRGSGLVVDRLGDAGLRAERKLLDFDQAAAHDVPTALEFIRKRSRGPLGAVGHCMGAGILAQAIATGRVTPEEHGLERVVLLTLGLFYEPPLDSRLKLQDHVLERLLDQREDVQAVDPRPGNGDGWPAPLEALYGRWPEFLRPHPRRGNSGVGEICARIAFMYGAPYLERNLVPEIHGEQEDGSFDAARAELPKQFGAIPLRMYVHGARNSRRGWAAGYQGEDLEGFAPPAKGREAKDGEESSETGPSAHQRFCELKRLTLITGDRNQLWHRDSIDRMYEWLRRGQPTHDDKFRKVIRRGYGHQDLLWGRDASQHVFPDIERGLRIPYCSPTQQRDRRSTDRAPRPLPPRHAPR